MSTEEKQTKREFGPSSLAVSNRTTVFVLAFIIMVLGFTAYRSMPRESFPEVVMPEIYIGTPYPGNSPKDIESLVTRPIEKEIKTITGVDKVTSTSIQDYSTIVVKFSSTVEVEEALRKVKDAVDRSKKYLPKDLDQDPNIFELNFSEFPIMNINLSGDFSMDKLKEYAEYLEDEIEKLEEISKVEIRGSREREVKVDVDIHKMEALEVSFNDIAGAINSENQTISGGNYKTGSIERTVRISGEFINPREVEDVIVKHEKGNIVYLKDIARVSYDYEERKSYARQNGHPVVMLDVVKRSGRNLIIASDSIRSIIRKAQKTVLPASLEISVTNDQSKQTRNNVSNLENSIISGVILVVLVLLFFMGLRNALFVGIAIPLSMFMGYLILGFMGVTLNMMVLFSLIMALGMLVDNGIVIVENIYRYMEKKGEKPVEASKKGAGEVAVPIISSTATTLAAFLPLAFWPGMMGEFMKYLPITLIIVMGSSLFVALVINPAITSAYMKIGKEANFNTPRAKKVSYILIGAGIVLALLKATTFSSLLLIWGIILLLNLFLLTPIADKFQTRILPKLEASYRRFLAFALNRSRTFFWGTWGLLILSIILIGVFTPKVLFFPENQPNYANIFIEKPIGTDIEATNAAAQKVESIVMNYIKKYEESVQENDKPVKRNFLVESVLAQVGEGTSDPAQGVSMGVTPHKARVTVSFVEFEKRKGINTSDVLEDIRALLKGFPGVQISVDKDAAGPPVGKPVNIEVIGENYEKLIEQTEEIKRFINSSGIAGIEELKTDMELGKPELLVTIDRDKARRFGLSTSQVASQIRTALFGMEVSKYKEDEDDFPIMVRLDEKYRNNPEVLLNQRITFRDPSNGRIVQVPISAVADFKKTTTTGSVKRKNLKRVVTISSNVLGGFNPNEVVAGIKKVMENYILSPGIEVKFTGEQEEQAKEMAFLSTALLFALFLVFLIIVMQFNSVGTPFIIMTSVLFSTIGVFLGLVIFQMDFVIIMTMIGIISLAGVVVNNSIVLIDYTNLLQEERKKALGMDKNGRLPLNELIDCIISGGQTRLRPVLLTAITTVLGLLPMAVGMNINFFTLLSDYDPQIYFGGDSVVFWGPLSWTVIFGLSFATFLTLVIVPVMYLIKERMKDRIVLRKLKTQTT
jgi:multidrug efflux pump